MKRRHRFSGCTIEERLEQIASSLVVEDVALWSLVSDGWDGFGLSGGIAMATAVELVADRLIRTLAEMTGNRPGQWRMLHDVAARLCVGKDVADRAVILAVEKGWAEERIHSVCLTDVGRRLNGDRSPP